MHIVRSRVITPFTGIAILLGLSLCTATSVAAIELPSPLQLVDGLQPYAVPDSQRSQAHHAKKQQRGTLDPRKAPPSIITSKRSFSGGSPAAMRRRSWTSFQKSVQSSASAELLEGVAEG